MTSENQELYGNPKAFHQQVRLAAVQVAALGPSELAAALAYELEPFSNIPADDADVAWRESAESNAAVRVYDVAVMRNRSRKERSGAGGGGRCLDAVVAAVAMLALAIVAVDWWMVSSRLTALRRDVVAQLPLDGELRRLEERTRSVAAEARSVREGRRTMEDAHDAVAALRSSIPDALEAVASVCGGRIVVKEISSPAPFAMEFRAAAVTADMATVTMARLGDALEAKGMRLTPGEIAASVGGAMVEFSFRISPAETKAKEAM